MTRYERQETDVVTFIPFLVAVLGQFFFSLGFILDAVLLGPGFQMGNYAIGGLLRLFMRDSTSWPVQ
jgi:hypothetical protein